MAASNRVPAIQAANKSIDQLRQQFSNQKEKQDGMLPSLRIVPHVSVTQATI